MAHRVPNIKIRNRPNFAVIGQSMIEISQFFEFQDGSRPPSWIFENSKILTLDRVMRVNMRHHAKSSGGRSNCCRNMAIFRFFKKLPSAILDFKILTVDCRHVGGS